VFLEDHPSVPAKNKKFVKKFAQFVEKSGKGWFTVSIGGEVIKWRRKKEEKNATINRSVVQLAFCPRCLTLHYHSLTCLPPSFTLSLHEN
jgi:hypothetical protein